MGRGLPPPCTGSHEGRLLNSRVCRRKTILLIHPCNTPSCRLCNKRPRPPKPRCLDDGPDAFNRSQKFALLGNQLTVATGAMITV